MNRVELHVYRDKIKKLHKAVTNLEKAHEDFTVFQIEKLVEGEIDDQGFKAMEKFFNNHPELTDMIDQINKKIKNLGGN